MTLFAEQLKKLKNEAQEVVLSHFEEGELEFSSRPIKFEDGGWSQRTSIDIYDLYKLSADFVCDLADELECGFLTPFKLIEIKNENGSTINNQVNYD